jgi:hypothetical protein
MKELVGEANAAGLALLFSLKHDFPPSGIDSTPARITLLPS